MKVYLLALVFILGSTYKHLIETEAHFYRSAVVAQAVDIVVKMLALLE